MPQVFEQSLFLFLLEFSARSAILKASDARLSGVRACNSGFSHKYVRGRQTKLLCEI